MVYSCVFLLLYSILKKSFYCYFQVTLLVHDCFDFGNDNTRRGTDGFLIRKINKEKGEQKQLQQQQQTSQYI